MKNQAAVELGHKGGLARKKNLTLEQLSAIGKRAAAARWKNKGKKQKKQNNISGYRGVSCTASRRSQMGL
jgi:hypothetical protein